MSTSSQHQFRYTQTPSKVLHLRNLPWECSEEELKELCKPFGRIVNTKCNVGANRNQAFVEFADLNQAISMVSYYASSSEPAMVRGKTVYIQYSNRHEIVNNKSPGDIPGNVLLVTIEGVEAGDVSIDVIHLVFSAFGFVHKIATFEKTAGFQIPASSPCWFLDYTNPMLPVNYTAIEGAVQTAVGPDGKRKEPESNVLLASIENMQYAVTVDVLHTVFSAFGTVQKIAIFEKNGQTQALIQYPDVVTAAAAREALEGHCIYDGGYCKLHLSYSRHTDLNVKAFSDKSRDYTVPDPSVLAAQGPATGWQNPQTAPMYPGSATAWQNSQTQVPGGQVPSWDPSLQAVRPSYVSAPGTFPVQTGAVPPMPSYAPAAMPAASSPLAQSSPISHHANPMGIAQPSGASLSVPGSSPLMQTSQGFVQPNARPAAASPAGQHYYG
ncbi:Polypyrimidine tract-binding protein-like 1 [Mucuna pruriens]|uniref:Polypyrimidine tract-binding protein-like 1 n=1 Tax=Mucuna pruriens TaxID=157652 RepID=A0A371HJU7_MUCPR|nr:Polypyrimidine tract-binding protein-like 1 [Mucuna pruriens]